MKSIREERGVAALTVMLISSVLAVAGGVLVLTTTAELERGGRDERAETVFADAEGGLDLAASHLAKEPTFAEGQTQDCLDNPLVPASAGIACEIKITSPSNGQIVYPANGRPFVEYTVAAKAVDAGSVSRTLVETYKLETVDVPYGFFVDGDVDFGGTPNLYNESVLVNGNVTSRDKISFDVLGDGPNDPDKGWRFHKHRIQSNPDPYLCSDGGVQVGCAGVFSNFQIYEKNLLVLSREIHSNSSDPAQQTTFRNDRDVHQTKVVNGTAQPVVTLPTNSVLELMDGLKPIAQEQGMYLNYKNGSNDNETLQPANFSTSTRNFEQNVVVYIDADAGDTIKWKVNLIPGSTSSDIKYINSSGARVGSQSGILAIRGGSLEMETTTWSGAIFAPENAFRFRGNNDCTCTIYAKNFSSSGGTATIRLTDEWFVRLPAGFAIVTSTGFFECEPFQNYPAGSKCAGV